MATGVPAGAFFLKNNVVSRNIVRFVILQACRGYRRARRGFFPYKNNTFLATYVYLCDILRLVSYEPPGIYIYIYIYFDL